MEKISPIFWKNIRTASWKKLDEQIKNRSTSSRTYALQRFHIVPFNFQVNGKSCKVTFFNIII